MLPSCHSAQTIIPWPDEHRSLYSTQGRNQNSASWIPHQRKWVPRIQCLKLCKRLWTGCSSSPRCHMGSWWFQGPDWTPRLPTTSLLPTHLASMGIIIINNKDGNCRIVCNNQKNPPQNTWNNPKWPSEVDWLNKSRVTDAIGNQGRVTWGSVPTISSPGL